MRQEKPSTIDTVHCKWCNKETPYLNSKECDNCFKLKLLASRNTKATIKIVNFLLEEKEEKGDGYTRRKWD